jgi:hypothetical protein
MHSLYWGLVVDPRTRKIVHEDKFVASSDDAAKVRLGAFLDDEDDLDDFDFILNRLGPVRSKRTMGKRRRDDDEEAV